MTVTRYPTTTCEACGATDVPMIMNLGTLGMHSIPDKEEMCEASYRDLTYEEMSA